MTSISQEKLFVLIRKHRFALAGSIILVILLIFLVFPPQTSFKQSGPLVSPTPYLQTVLWFNPNPLQAQMKGNSLILYMQTKSNKINGVQLQLSFDPTVLTNVKIHPSGLFSNATVLAEKYDNKKGVIVYIMGRSINSTAVVGTGEIAKLSFDLLPTSINKRKTSIGFMTKTLVAATGVNPQVLQAAYGASILLSPLPNTTTP